MRKVKRNLHLSHLFVSKQSGIKVNSALFGQAGAPAKYQQVLLQVEGEDLLFIKKATYFLPKTFINSVKTVERSLYNPNFGIHLYTWGAMSINVDLEDYSGNITKLKYFVNNTAKHPVSTLEGTVIGG